MRLFRGTRAALKPFEYTWAYEFYQKASRLHWTPSEVHTEKDLDDWKHNLTEGEKNLLEKVFVFLANADTDVGSNYTDKLIPNFPLPELRAMMVTFAAMEQIHSESYALTLDSLAFNPEVFSAFLDIKEMFDKHVFVTQQRTESLTEYQKMLLDIAINSIFGEGMMLYSAFVMILAFDLRGLMTAVSSLTKYIAKDEDLHCEGMTRVFKTMVQEAPEEFTPELLGYILEAGHKAVELENHFIDLAFSLGDIENLNKDDLKRYIQFMANKRMLGAGLPMLYPEVLDNPLRWTYEMFGASVKTQNFERTGSEYQKANLSGSWTVARERRQARPEPTFKTGYQQPQ